MVRRHLRQLEQVRACGVDVVPLLQERCVGGLSRGKYLAPFLIEEVVLDSEVLFLLKHFQLFLPLLCRGVGSLAVIPLSFAFTIKPVCRMDFWITSTMAIVFPTCSVIAFSRIASRDHDFKKLVLK